MPGGHVLIPLVSGAETASRAGLAVGDDTEKQATYVANDLISLIFVDKFNGDEIEFHSPEYTHQLFDDEKFDFVESESEDEDDLETTVLVRLSDLKHRVILPRRKLTEQELSCLKKGLSRGLPTDTAFETYSDKLAEVVDAFADEAGDALPTPSLPPPGTLMHSWVQSSETYELWLASNKDQGAADLLVRFEKLALWYIETADSIDFSDDRWQAVFLVKRDKSARPVYCGVYTLFTFRNPFAGSKLRVCTALVLPPFQGRGLGREVMLAVYRLCRGLPEVVEVTVEDPAPAFQRLRDSVDFEWCGSRCDPSCPSASNNNAVTAAAASAAAAIAKEVKLTVSQVTFVLDAYKYARITSRLRSTTIGQGQEGEGRNEDEQNDAEDALTAFRLSVKRRLLSAHGDLRELPKQDMQKELEALWEEERKRLQRVARKVKA